MKFIIIKTKSEVYISDNVNNDNYHSSKIPGLLFDGSNAKSTFKPGWYQLDKMPQVIQKKLPDREINIRFELKESYPENSLTPKVVTDNVYDEDSDYYEVRGLYIRKYDTEPGGYEIIEPELIVLSEDPDFKLVRQDFSVKYSLLDQINVHPALIHTKPCSISSADLYVLVRKYIKSHINNMVAKISSDYDFCLSVNKIISLVEPLPYKIDIGSKRKPNLITKFRDTRTAEVFQCAPKPYQNYTVLDNIHGENYEDLQQKVQKYLDDIMDEINRPVKECPTCCGAGVTTIN